MKKCNVVVKRSDFRNNRRNKKNNNIDYDKQLNEKMITRFNRKCKKERIVNELKERSHFTSKKEKRRKKKARAVKRINKLLNSSR